MGAYSLHVSYQYSYIISTEIKKLKILVLSRHMRAKVILR
jgi:hypothetical protein